MKLKQKRMLPGEAVSDIYVGDEWDEYDKKSKLKMVAAGAAAALAIAGTGAAIAIKAEKSDQPAPEKTTISAVTHNPELFNRKRIEMKGFIKEISQQENDVLVPISSGKNFKMNIIPTYVTNYKFGTSEVTLDSGLEVVDNSGNSAPYALVPGSSKVYGGEVDVTGTLAAYEVDGHQQITLYADGIHETEQGK